MQRDVYSGRLKLLGEEHIGTLSAACNYATGLKALKRSEEAKALLRKTMPVTQRVLGQNHDLMLRMRLCYAFVLDADAGASLADLREAVQMLEETERTSRRVLGGAHPFTAGIASSLQNARAILGARESGREVKIIRDA